jgi:serine/threonine protein kinase
MNGTPNQKCPRCGAEIPSGSSAGVCPRCAAGLLQATETEIGGGTEVMPDFTPPTVAELAPLFPQLEILELLGRGGMGAVYKARQKELDRMVALKILPPRIGLDPAFAERFAREAKALAKLNHPGIVTIHDFGRADGLFFFVMEFVDGMNLSQLMARGRVAPREALAIVPQICDALQYAHDQGIVHRDIKPENILIDRRGRAKVADFGVAKLMGTAEGMAEGGSSAAGGPSLTAAGKIMGTPNYMAPEQKEHPAEVDHRVDIYALGVVFYQMLTGELPGKQLQPPSQKVQIDVRLDNVVLHALEKNPKRRYQTVGEMKTAMDTIAGTAEESPVNPEALAADCLARDYQLNIRSCLSRGWKLVRSDFWPIVGVTALILVLLSALGSSSQAIEAETGKSMHVDIQVITLLLFGPLIGGLSYYFLKRVRGEPVRAEAAFSGFKKSFLQLLLAGLVSWVLTGLGFICLILPGIYLLVAFEYTFILVMDKRIDFWPAMHLSRKMIGKHWWKFFGFLLTLLLVDFLGALCLCVGVFVAVPVTLAALMYAYEDIFPPAAPSPQAAPGRGGA